MTRPRLLTSTALIGILALGLTSGQAMAACDNNAPTSGTTITCTGADTTGISGAVNSVTVNMVSGSSITTTGSTNAINLGNANILASSGPAFSSVTDTIVVGGGSIALGGGGSITSTNGSAIKFNGTPGAAFSVALAGSASGGNGTAIDFGQSAATLSYYYSTSITGNVLAGSGTNDIFRIRGGASGTLDVSEFGTKYTGFDIFQKIESSTFTLTGTGNQSWDVQAGTLQGNTTSMSGNLAVSSGANVTFNQTSTGTYSSTISGAGSLTKTGGGQLTLSGAQTYTGGTTISGGTLLGSTNSLQGNILNNSILAFNQASNGTYSGIISGTGALQKSGTGIITLTGTNTYSGVTNFNGGAFNVSADSNLGTGNMRFDGGMLQYGAAFTSAKNITLGTGGTIDTNSFNSTLTGVISGSGGLVKTGAGDLTLSGTNTYTGGTTIDGGAIVVSSDSKLGNVSGALTLINGGALKRAGGNPDIARNVIVGTGGGTINSNGAAMTVSGVISGSGRLTKNGSGTLTLSGTNTYLGGTSISAGTLLVSSDANLGDTSGNISFTGSTLQYGSGFSSARSITLNSAGGTVDTNGFNSTLSGVISGAGGLTKSGSGIMTLTGTNTYAGGTNINSGILNVSSDNNLGTGGITFDGGTLQNGASFTTAKSVTLNSGGGTFDTNNYNFTVSGAITGTGALTKTGAGSLILTGANTYSGGTTVSGGRLIVTTSSISGNVVNNNLFQFAQSTNGTYSGIISGTGMLEKTAAGTVTLTGVNTYTGGTIINGGAISISSNANLGDVTSGITFNGGTLQQTSAITSSRAITLNSGGGTLDTGAFNTTLSGTISGTGSFTKTGNGTLSLTAANTYTGGTTVSGGILRGNTTSLQGDIVNNANVTFNQTVTGTYSGVMSGTGILTKVGSGTLTLSGTNTHSGGTIITGGALRVGSDAAFGTGALTLDGGTLLQNASFTTTKAVSLGSNGGTIDTAGSSSTFSGVFSGSGSLTKLGSGTLALTGNNTYTGGTIISDGTVQINSNANLGAASSTLTLDGGTLRHNAAISSTRDVILASSGGTIDTGTFLSSISGTLSGTGSLTKTGTGTLTLSGTNTYTGGTLISAGTLQGTTSSIKGNIVNNSSLFLNQSTDGTYSGIISGTGVLTKTGSGTVTLAGANTYTGNTRIQGGILNVSAENNLGSTSNSVLFESGTLQYGASFTSTRGFYVGATNGTIDTNGYNGIISGSITGSPGGTLTKTGSGILALTGTGSFTGDMIVSGGILAGTTSNLLGNISNNAELAFDQTISGTYAGIVSGNGALTKYGSGTVTLSGANTYSGGTTIYGGTLIGTTTSLQGDIDNDSVLRFDQATNGTYSSVISGSGVLAKYGTGVVTLTGTNTYTGGTIVAAGSLVGTTSSLQGDILNNANITFDQTTNGTYADNITGTGTLTKTGAGIVTLTGTNTYSGGTTVSAGSLVGTDLTLQGNITNNANVTFNQATNGTYSGAMSGTGDLVKNGTGNLILSNTNTYSGGTTVNAGRLSVNGSITGTTTVGASGTLGGSGSFGTIINNGRIAPGNSIGTMTVNGDITFNTGSVYEVEVNAAGSSDRINATGALIINGGMVNVMAASGAYADSTTYTILQGASRTGTFNGIMTDLVFLTPTLSYTATNVNLTLDRNDVDFAIVAEDNVQAGVANAVQNLGSSSDLYTAFSGLNMQEASKALDTLSGEHNAGITTATSQSMTTVRSIVTNRIQNIAGNGSRNINYNSNNVSSITPAAGDDTDPEIKKNFWSQAFGYVGHSNSQGTAPAQNRESGGVLFGADATLSSDTLAGILGGYESSEVYTDSQGANSDVSSWHAGIYANHQLTPSWRISGNILGTFHDIDTTRHIIFTGYSATPKGETSGYTISPTIETGYSFAVRDVTFEPFIGLSITHSYIGKYSEKQGGSSNLDVDSVSQTNPSHTLGLNVSKSFSLNEDANLRISAQAAWNHTYGELDATQTMQFASGTLPFDVKGAGLSRNSALIGLGAELDINPMGGKAYLDYSGDISKDTENHGVTMGLKFPF